MIPFLLDPNIGYMLLIGGFVLAVLALFAPGTGLLEIGALFMLVTAGYIMVNLPVNLWALVLMLISLVPFVLAVRRTRGRTSYILLGGAIVALVLGSIFIFRSESGGPAVNPLLALIGSGGSAALLWFMARKSLDAFIRPPSHDPNRVSGQVGKARTDLRPEGSVYVGGEEWSAIATGYVPAGTSVRVTGRTGLVLQVERLSEEDKN
ncbi:MAG: hypothetical protein HY835_00625 [Anaerolineae bacterium]|nr:hypothetical protein [Anaerolineae bacterium]